MPIATKFKTVSLYSFAAFICCATTVGFAQTDVESAVSVPATGSSLVYNNLVITNGCSNPATPAKAAVPVVGQSVVIPTVSPVITDLSTGTASSLTVSDLFLTSVGGTGLSSLAGMLQLIQNNDLFSVQKEKTDSLGNVIGFEGKKGKLAITLFGKVPFAVNPVFFNPAKCINSVKINLATADVCKLTVKANGSGPAIGSANLWFPNRPSNFLNDAVGRDHIPTLILNNTATADASCASGNINNYTISASDADIKANMPMSGYWNK